METDKSPSVTEPLHRLLDKSQITPDRPAQEPATNKSVSVAVEGETSKQQLHPTLDKGGQRDSITSQGPRQHRANIGPRPSVRLPMATAGSSVTSRGNGSNPNLLEPAQEENSEVRARGSDPPDGPEIALQYRLLRGQVEEWLQHEKARRAIFGRTAIAGAVNDESRIKDGASTDGKKTAFSEVPDEAESLEELERILAQSVKLDSPVLRPTVGHKAERKKSQVSRRPSTSRMMKRRSTAGTSDNELSDNEISVPTCDVVLDNSKTMSYLGGAAQSAVQGEGVHHKASSEQEAWSSFKHEIVRLALTLRLKGWRRVPLDRANDIQVERLSGALTNAVYVVTPPKDLSAQKEEKSESHLSLAPKKPPPKLLLRIYGPQVEQLIDREAELQILRRLAKKNIGPRLLGTFRNGRFEQFFHARTLTHGDLRIPEVSKQIAKRMRELHDGIELLESERDAGPFVWRNWDKWVERSEEIVTWLDRKIISGTQGQVKSRLDAWKDRGLVCGVEWHLFRETVEKYRTWLVNKYGGDSEIRSRLVFAHNDTQYGNLLRLEPSGESPLLLPANEHKRLIVIDFEYASANLPGLEFANHFTEWCYNYHDPKKPYALNEAGFPTAEEQRRFIRTYVVHQPVGQIGALRSLSSAASRPQDIASFNLDRALSPEQMIEEDDRREKAKDDLIDQLMEDTRLWRVVNSAQWVAWGAVQAKIADLAAEEASKSGGNEPITSGLPEEDSKPEALGTNTEHSEEAADLIVDKRPEATEIPAANANEPSTDDEDDEFDYLGYAQERALFFWGDVLQMGIISREDLPAELLPKLKVINH